MDPDRIVSELEEDWVLKKSAARASSASQTPHRMVTSFTDQQPAHGWEPKHALREFWQNFKDGLRERFCGQHKDLKIDMHAEPGNDVFKAYFGTREVGLVDVRTANQLVISQSQCILSLEALQLASFKRANNDGGETIGGHGEGFKVGINLLLRHGFAVTYSMPFVTWYFSLQHVYSERCRNMVVDIVPHDEERDDLQILVEGSGAHTLFDPEIDLQLTPELRLECECSSGSMYSCRYTHHFGRIYCRGLYVASDDDFKHLELVVNLNTHIARDRHLLPGNTWNLIEAILNEESQREQAPLLLHLLTICRSLDENVLRKSLAFIKPPLRKHIAFLNRVSEQSVVFIRNDTSPFERLLRDLGKFVVSGSGALADAVDVHSLKQEYVMSKPCMEISALKAVEKIYYDAFRSFGRALHLNFNRSFNDNVLVKDIPPSLADILPVYEGDSIIIPRLLLVSVEEVVFLALLCIQKFSYGDRVVQSKIFMDFSKDPLNFEPRKIVTADETDYSDLPVAAKPSTTADPFGNSTSLGSSDVAAKGHQSDGSAAGAVQDMGQGAGMGTGAGSRPPEDTDLLGEYVHSDEPNPRVRTSTFKGVPTGPLDVGGEDGVQVSFPACGKYVGSLIPTFVGDLVMYFGDTVLSLQEDEAFMASLARTAPVIDQLVNELRVNIARTLAISDQNFPVILVLVTDTILGFTDGGGVYLNCKPLLDDLILSSSRGNTAEPNPEVTGLLSLVRTEVHCPEILAYATVLINELKDQVLKQQNAIDAMVDSAQERGSAEESFTASLYQMDIERIRYTLARYLRTRLLKIERNLDFIINSDEMMERLSNAERVFATKLYGQYGNYIEDVIQKRFKGENGESVNEELEGAVSMSDDLLKHTRPALDTFVFCVSTDDIYDSQSNLWPRGEVKIVLYSTISEQVHSGEVNLL